MISLYECQSPCLHLHLREGEQVSWSKMCHPSQTRGCTVLVKLSRCWGWAPPASLRMQSPSPEAAPANTIQMPAPALLALLQGTLQRGTNRHLASLAHGAAPGAGKASPGTGLGSWAAAEQVHEPVKATIKT